MIIGTATPVSSFSSDGKSICGVVSAPFEAGNSVGDPPGYKCRSITLKTSSAHESFSPSGHLSRFWREARSESVVGRGATTGGADEVDEPDAEDAADECTERRCEEEEDEGGMLPCRYRCGGGRVERELGAMGIPVRVGCIALYEDPLCGGGTTGGDV